MPLAHSTIWWPRHRLFLSLGRHRYDLATRALVMGILDWTTNSVHDDGSHFNLDRFFERAEQLVREGADLLDVGGVKAGAGPQVTEEEELDRVVPVIASLRDRFDLPLSADTWRASVARAAFEAGAVVGNDMSGFADPDYLSVAAAAGASVVATHTRLSPRAPDHTPHHDDVVAEVGHFLLKRAERALLSGIPADHIILDAGLELGKTADQSLLLLHGSARLASLGYPLLLSSSDRTPLGVMPELGFCERPDASLAAAAAGIVGGCRIIRVHDVAGTCKVRDLLAAILESAPQHGAGPDGAGPDGAGPLRAGPLRAGVEEAGPQQAGPQQAGETALGPGMLR